MVSTLSGVYSFGVTEMHGPGDNYGGFKVLVGGSQAGPCFLLPYEHSKPAAKRVGCSIEGVHRRLEHTGYAVMRGGAGGVEGWGCIGLSLSELCVCGSGRLSFGSWVVGVVYAELFRDSLHGKTIKLMNITTQITSSITIITSIAFITTINIISSILT